MYPITQYNREGGADDRNHLTISTGYVFILMKYIVYIYIIIMIIITETMTITIIMQYVQRAHCALKNGFLQNLPQKKLGELGTSVKIILPKKTLRKT